MESFKDYYNRNIDNVSWQNLTHEERYSSRVSLEELPDFKPAGFCVLPDGSYIIITASQTHAQAIERVYGSRSYGALLCPGGIRMARGKDLYYIDFIPSKVSRKALSTAKDICKWYNTGFEEVRITKFNCDEITI